MPETYTWTPVAAELPDDDTTVLICNAEWSTPVWMRYHDGDGWRTIEQNRLDGSAVRRGTVKNTAPTHWRHLPELPVADTQKVVLILTDKPGGESYTLNSEFEPVFQPGKASAAISALFKFLDMVGEAHQRAMQTKREG